MGIGVSVLLLAVGAVLAFAVHVTTNGFDVNTVGVILMVVGGLGLLVALAFAGGGWAGWGGYRRTTYVDDGVAPGRMVRHDTFVD